MPSPTKLDVFHFMMSTTMASRMKLSFHLQRHRSTQDDRYIQSQGQNQPPQVLPTQPEEPTPPPDEQEERHQASICAANDFIHDLITSDDRWSSHIALIRINCPYTLNELHGLGSLPQPEGVAACRKLIRVPVIHEELGLFIWTQLATLARGPKVTPKESNSTRTEKGARYQHTEGLFPAHLDDRFRFDMPASMAARTRHSDSPPMSPKDVQQRSYFTLHENIDEGDEEGLENSQTELPPTTRGRVASRSSQRQRSSATRPDGERQRSFFSNNSSRNGSHATLLRWSRERGTQSPASRASSTTRNRSGSLAGRLGSAVGGLGQKVAGALGDGTSQNRSRSRSRSRSARSL